MAYALDLDPRRNLRSRLPVPILTDDSLSLTFHAARPGLTYTVQTSTDLRNWTTEGVTPMASAPPRSLATPRSVSCAWS